MAPLPPLSRAFRSLAQGGYPTTTAAPWTIETVDAAFDDTTYQVRGVRIPSTGRVPLRVGDRVPVGWANGRPVTILAHAMRRSGGVRLAAAGAIVEELILAELETGGYDVFFRNDQQVTRLDIAGDINADTVAGDFQTGPRRVFWGQTDNTFMVQTLGQKPGDPTKHRPRFYVYRLSRVAGTPAGASTVSATLVKVVDTPVFDLPGTFATELWVATPSEDWLLYQSSGGTAGSNARPQSFWRVFTGVPVFPYDVPAPLEAVLTPDLTVHAVAAVQFAPTIKAHSLLDPDDIIVDFTIGQYTSIIAVECSPGVTGPEWESSIVETYRLPSTVPPDALLQNFDPGGPGPDEVVLAWQVTRPFIQPVDVQILEWSSSRRIVAVAWQRYRYLMDHEAGDGSFPSTTDNFGEHFGGTLVETNGAVLASIFPWVEIPDSTLGELLLDQPLSIVNLLDGSPTHALWSGVIYTQGLPTVRQTQRVGLYDVTAATSRTVGEVSNVDPNDARLFNRAGAIRLLLARDGYVVAEEVTDVPENERARFTALGTLDLTPGQAIGEDSALGGQGAMKELPAEVDALTSRDRAYHVVGSP